MTAPDKIAKWASDMVEHAKAIHAETGACPGDTIMVYRGRDEPEETYYLCPAGPEAFWWSSDDGDSGLLPFEHIADKDEAEKARAELARRGKEAEESVVEVPSTKPDWIDENTTGTDIAAAALKRPQEDYLQALAWLGLSGETHNVRLLQEALDRKFGRGEGG